MRRRAESVHLLLTSCTGGAAASAAGAAGGAVADADLLAFGEGIGRVEDDVDGGGEAGGDLECAAVVLGDGDVLEMDTAVANEAHLRALSAEEQGVGWNRELLCGLRELEVDEGVGAGEQLVVLVRDVDFHVEGAAVLVDGGGVPGDGAGETLAGILVQGEGGGLAVVNGGGVDLGDGD